ncbi:MAG: hypothetical protein C0475_09205 [Planctomyces sp.]|nr:hypothetical protein [Planctomyces sp.]
MRRTEPAGAETRGAAERAVRTAVGMAGAVMGPVGTAVTALSPERTLATQTLFWHNVAREMLTALSAMSMNQTDRRELDGRIAILTQAGERIPIAAISPLFACGVPTGDMERDLSIAVECSVFRVTTPAGEVFTIPLHQVRAIHALTDELVHELEELQRGQRGEGTPGNEPFGFAAFRSLTQQSRPAQSDPASPTAPVPLAPEAPPTILPPIDRVSAIGWRMA